MSNISKTCPFCSPIESRVIIENDQAIAILDGFPISKGHSLIIPKRHVSSIFEIQKNELIGLFNLLTDVKNKLTEQFNPARMGYLTHHYESVHFLVLIVAFFWAIPVIPTINNHI
jgi:diadenosine tetraphosphate (Ap4A) HIT family hydrolase